MRWAAPLARADGSALISQRASPDNPFSYGIFFAAQNLTPLTYM